MHELSIAQQILENVEREVRKQPVSCVTGVHLRVGRYSVDKQSLTFCLEAVTMGTLMEGAAIQITDLEEVLNCPDCGPLTEEQVVNGVCSICGRWISSSLGGVDIILQEIEYECEKDDIGEESSIEGV